MEVVEVRREGGGRVLGACFGEGRKEPQGRNSVTVVAKMQRICGFRNF